MKPGKLQRSKQRYQDLYCKVHYCAQSFVLLSLCMNYITKTLLLVSSSVQSKHLLCFVHNQGQKGEQKQTAKKFVGSHSYSPLLAMLFHPIRYKPKPIGTHLHTLDVIITSCFGWLPW